MRWCEIAGLGSAAAKRRSGTVRVPAEESARGAELLSFGSEGSKTPMSRFLLRRAPSGVRRSSPKARKVWWPSESRSREARSERVFERAEGRSGRGPGGSAFLATIESQSAVRQGCNGSRSQRADAEAEAARSCRHPTSYEPHSCRPVSRPEGCGGLTSGG